MRLLSFLLFQRKNLIVHLQTTFIFDIDMKYLYSLVFFGSFFLFSCKKESKSIPTIDLITENSVEYASGFELHSYENYTILTITQPWPGAKTQDRFILHRQDADVPDSLKQLPHIQVPLQSIVATSTTHIPSLEALGVEDRLIGFPNTDYISSAKTRFLIDSGKIKDVGMNEALNTELLIDLAPDVVIGFGINNSNPTLDVLRKSGQQVIFNGDWVEQSPLGKAEWIKLFGALFDKQDMANQIFRNIVTEYDYALSLTKKHVQKPTVLSGAIYQGKWYLPQGESWFSLLFKNAQANYLWSNTKGVGSLSLPFEVVFNTARDADLWIGPAQFSSLQEMANDNPHYKEFKAFKNKKIYSYSTKKGAKGGLLYYELAPTRPDLVLKDLIKITHPEWIPEHELVFFELLK